MFSEKDLAQMAQRGITREQAEQQINYFRSGFPYLSIDRAAVVGDGITRLDPEEAANLAARYGKALCGRTIEKFVPASGAATRMFKDLYSYIGDGKMNPAVEKTLDNLKRFAFYGELKKLGVNLDDPKAVIGAIIENGLGYGKQPKGLITFHAYSDGSVRTALEEHLVEVALYGGSPAKIHFTVSPEHRPGFEAVIGEKLQGYSEKYGVEYQISYSVQEPSTDTIAVDLANEPFREADGSLLFRPAGHGALINNLNRIDADLIFIKTIDNVVPDHLKADTVLYKKALGGLALELQQQVFDYIRSIDAGRADSAEIARFIETRLGCKLSAGASFADLRAILDRPLRVCGMVRNEGEPGGGPFWVKAADGSQSLQIAESSQISPEQMPLMKQATHFNPVDLVCAVRDLNGNKMNLTQYIDPETGFISQKSKDGRDLKAQELPGLWNGAMAQWNTIFVEVPISTFAPVKTIVDLLRPQHQ